MSQYFPIKTKNLFRFKITYCPPRAMEKHRSSELRIVRLDRSYVICGETRCPSRKFYHHRIQYITNVDVKHDTSRSIIRVADYVLYCFVTVHSRNSPKHASLGNIMFTAAHCRCIYYNKFSDKYRHSVPKTKHFFT